MTLTYYERVSLILLLEVLKSMPRQDSISDESIDHMREALAHGWEKDYFSAIDMWVDTKTLSAAECNEVIDILQMHRMLIGANFEQYLRNEEDDFFLRFRGFSGNEESRYHAYAIYLIEKMGLFMELKSEGGYNSHFPMLDRYRRMASEWRKSADPYKLDGADVSRILAASKRAP